MEEKNIKLFLVDDDPMVRDLYERAFRLMGYDIETAIDGQDAVEKLDKMEKLPKLILLDILMPKMTGFDVLHYIKNSAKLKDILVVTLTSVSETEVAEKTLKLGASCYLVKSDYEPAEIAAKVEEVIAENSK